MIYVEMHGRLGNQLFQYSAARSLQKKNKQVICMSFNRVIDVNTEGDSGWNDSLIDFNTVHYEVYNKKRRLYKELNVLKQLIIIIYVLTYKPFVKDIKGWHEYQKKWCPVLDKKGIRWFANGYYPFINDNETDVLLCGTFESPAYFEDIREDLLEEIVPKYEEMEQNRELYSIIRNTNSVCVSLRHFRLSGYQNDLYDVCSKDYYAKAIETMKMRLDSPHFIFFSDDIDWISSVIDFSNLSYSIETSNNPLWEKLRLMYSCKHFIIPNSTFAWWAQYLSRNNEKIVIGPSKWFNNAFDSPLIQDDWICIDKMGNITRDQLK